MSPAPGKRWQKILLSACAALLLGGCAVGKDPRDPLENFNRAMFSFNDTLDQYAIKPVAEVYRDNLPSFVQTGVYNFFSNIGDVWTSINNMLQGNFSDGISDVMRIAINTGFGFGGLLDIASEAGLPRHKQDFGVTLGVWGVGSGPYVVLPLFGFSTLRDSVALPADLYGDPLLYHDPVWQRNTARALRIVDARSGLLDAGSLIEDAALDRYEFLRDGYLQRRANKIEDSRNRREEQFQQPAKDEDK